MLHHRLASGPGNTDDVEARVALVEFFLAQEILRRLNHLSLLSELHRLQGRAKTMPGTGLHFDENNDAAIQDDQIQFARRAAVISLDQFVAFMFEIKFGNPFPFFAQDQFAVVRSWLKQRTEVSRHEPQGFTHRLKALAVNRRWAVTLQRFEMRRAAIAFVASEAVLGILFVELDHHGVARDLCKDRGGSDGNDTIDRP